METPGTSTPKNSEGQFVSVQRLPYRSPALIEYGSVSKLTEGSTERQAMATPACMIG